MLPTSKKLRGHIGFGLSIRVCHILWTVDDRVLKFHIYGFLMEKYLTHIFFLVQVITLSGIMPLWKNQNDIWCLPWTVHARILKFHIWICSLAWAFAIRLSNKYYNLMSWLIYTLKCSLKSLDFSSNNKGIFRIICNVTLCQVLLNQAVGGNDNNKISRAHFYFCFDFWLQGRTLA